MLVEQAIFTSVQTRLTQGYHLVNSSPGVDEDLAKTLSQWSPTHAGLVSEDVRTASLNFFTAPSGQLVLSRSLYGGPEYSGRGGFQIVTLLVVLRSSQLAGYAHNPLSLASTLLIGDSLRLGNAKTLAGAGRLPQLEVPDSSVLDSGAFPRADRRDAEAVQSVSQLLSQHSRIAVIGCLQPLSVLNELMKRLPDQQRTRLSFSTATNPSVNRPFRLQFLPELDPHQKRQLKSQGVHCFAA